jgi:hypothetical protein
MNRLGGLNQRVARAHYHGLSWADHVRLASRANSSVPLNFAGENGVCQLSLNDDADLGAWVVMNWKHRSGHDSHSAQGQLGIFDGHWRGSAENLASDYRWRGGFWSSMLGKRNRRASCPQQSHTA